MSETISSARRPASSAARFAKAKRLRPAFVAGGILLALALAVVLLRLHRLTEIPLSIDTGEGANGLDALRVLQGEHAVFFPDKENGREGMIMYAMALSISLLGRTGLALRLPTALASAGTVFVVFWLGRLLFGRDEESGRATPWRGLLIGGIGAGLLAVSLGQTIIARTAFRTTFLPLFLCLCLALLWQGRRLRVRHGGTWWLAALAGVCAGLLPYTYIAARFVPFLFLFFGLSFVLPLRSGAWERLRAELPWISLFMGVAGLVAAPILVHFALHPEHFASRSGPLSVFRPSHSQGDPLGAFLVNVWDHLLVFGFRGDPYWRHNFAERPMLNIYEAFFFWLGAGMAVWRWQRRPAYRLLLLWLGVLILPAVLSVDLVWLGPNTLRMIGAVPAIYLLTGVGMWEAVQFLRERCRALPWRANRIFQENETRAAIAVGAVVGGLILVQGVITYRTYFQKWAAAPEIYDAYDQEWTDLARALNAQPSGADMVYLIPYYGADAHYGFEYLYQGTASAHIIRAATPHNLAQKIESTLGAMENVATVRVVDWDNDLVGGDANGDEHIVLLLGKYGRYLGSQEGTGFQIHTYTDVSLDQVWTIYEQLEPLTVHYDGGISLLGLALGQGKGQLSSQQLNLGQERALWVALQWQSAPGLEIDYSVSLRLHDAEGGGVYQKDAVLSDANPFSTSNWSADELVDTLHLLDFPADLLPGEYELRLVVYDYETLKPTVELGVWEPEFVLARLRLADVQ